MDLFYFPRSPFRYSRGIERRLGAYLSLMERSDARHAELLQVLESQVLEQRES